MTRTVYCLVLFLAACGFGTVVLEPNGVIRVEHPMEPVAAHPASAPTTPEVLVLPPEPVETPEAREKPPRAIEVRPQMQLPETPTPGFIHAEGPVLVVQLHDPSAETSEVLAAAQGVILEQQVTEELLAQALQPRAVRRTLPEIRAEVQDRYHAACEHSRTTPP